MPWTGKARWLNKQVSHAYSPHEQAESLLETLTIAAFTFCKQAGMIMRVKKSRRVNPAAQVVYASGWPRAQT
jgi:hypothetical protein